MRDATRAARRPTTGMARTIVIRTKLSGITSSSTNRKFDRPGRRAGVRRGEAYAAFYRAATDRGKNVRGRPAVFGFGTPSSKAGQALGDKTHEITYS